GRHARSRSNHRGSLALRPQERSHTAAAARAVASLVTLLGKGMQVVAWPPNDRMKRTAPASWSAAAYPSVGQTCCDRMSNEVRRVAICVFRHADRILVARGHDALKGQHFMRPLGGRIEFGELAADALRREIREELNAEIHEPELLGVLE